MNEHGSTLAGEDVEEVAHVGAGVEEHGVEPVVGLVGLQHAGGGASVTGGRRTVGRQNGKLKNGKYRGLCTFGGFGAFQPIEKG